MDPIKTLKFNDEVAESEIRTIPDEHGELAWLISPSELLQATHNVERVFYIKQSLWEALAPLGGVFDPNAVWNAIWPFNVTTIRFRDTFAEDYKTDAAVIAKRHEIVFVRRTGCDGAPNSDESVPLQLISMFTKADFREPQNDIVQNAILRQGILIAPNSLSSHGWTYMRDDKGVVSDDNLYGITLQLSRFVAFCNMLTYSKHLINVRKLERNKKKRVPFMTMANGLPQSAYEIVLRPEFTIYEAGEHIQNSLQSNTPRAHPRRHYVPDYIRPSTGSLVSGYWRGGILDEDAPRPVYNSMPLARWYTKNP